MLAGPWPEGSGTLGAIKGVMNRYNTLLSVVSDTSSYLTPFPAKEDCGQRDAADREPTRRLIPLRDLQRWSAQLFELLAARARGRGIEHRGRSQLVTLWAGEDFNHHSVFV
jgi:hypothetical protein